MRSEGRRTIETTGNPLMKVHRRRILQACGALIAGTVVPAWAADLVATPAQMRGPFYPLSLPLDQDNDLVSVKGRSGFAHGMITNITGQVLMRRVARRPACASRSGRSMVTGAITMPVMTATDRSTRIFRVMERQSPTPMADTVSAPSNRSRIRDAHPTSTLP